VAAALGTAVALTIGSAPPALATATSALTHTLTQSDHRTAQDGGYGIRNGRITGRYDTTCTTRADPVRHLEATSCQNSPVLRGVGGYRHLRFVHPVRPGKHWERRPAACRPDLSKIAINGIAAATPQQMLSEIKDAGNVTVVGQPRGPGGRAPGTRSPLQRRSGRGSAAPWTRTSKDEPGTWP
jgi:hypothetical protein